MTEKIKEGDTVMLTEPYANLLPGAHLVIEECGDAREPENGQLLYSGEYSIYSRRVKLVRRAEDKDK